MKFNWFTAALMLIFLIMMTTNTIVIKLLSVGVCSLYLGHVTRKVWLEFNEE